MTNNSKEPDGSKTEGYKYISVLPCTKALGAEISGINIAEELSPEIVHEIRRAWLENIVVFFRNQPIEPQQLHNFLSYFGEVRDGEARLPIPRHPDVPSVLVQEHKENIRIEMGEDVDWHSDNSFREIPQKCSVIHALDVPAVGGDTCWINMHSAYEALSDSVRRMCDELTAVHDLMSIMGPGVREIGGIEAFKKFAESIPPVEHPVVRINPDTNKRCLYVNPLMTARIKDVSPIESKSILNMLFAHITQHEFIVRFHWEKDSIAFWDNRSSIHKGINDFFPQYRLLHRVFIDEETRPSAR